MSRTGTVENEVAEAVDSRLRIKTVDVCTLLSCDEKTLRNWEKVCSRLFAPVIRQKNGNIYHPKQVRIMARVMNRRLKPEEGAELWERTDKGEENAIYRDAGDTSRGGRK